MAYRFHLERDELEARLGGGIPQGSLVVLEGEYGSGKSLLLQRLLFGLLKNDATASLVSTEHTTVHFIEQMHSLDYPVDEFVLNRRLLFLPVYPVLGFRGRKEDLMDRLLNARRMYESDIVAVDTFSSLVKDWVKALPPDATPRAVSARIEDALYRFKLLNTQGKTVILTLQPDDIPPDIASALKAVADVYISLRLEVTGGAVSRSLFVRRFGRAEGPVADVVSFRVEPRAGLVVEIKSVS